ncbi:MAG: DUF5117 domain-containing protein, partial [Neisseria elongata]
MASRDGYMTLSLNTSIVQLPEVPMQPRLADERVGYFSNKLVTFSDRETSKHDAIVSRYRLVPKDKKAYAKGKLVEPIPAPDRPAPDLLLALGDDAHARTRPGPRAVADRRPLPHECDVV